MHIVKNSRKHKEIPVSLNLDFVTGMNRKQDQKKNLLRKYGGKARIFKKLQTNNNTSDKAKDLEHKKINMLKKHQQNAASYT